MTQHPVTQDLAPDLRNLVAPASPIRVGDVELVPLVARRTVELPAFDLLEDGIRSGKTVVAEVGEGGRVGEVFVRHGGPGSLLILDGEEILGAKQNRAFNGSFLVPPGTTVRLPVSCVERGRWRPTSRTFSSASRTIPPSVRASKVHSTVDTLVIGRGYGSNQSAVWQEVTNYGSRTLDCSPTEALADAMTRRTGQLAAAIEAIPVLPEQVGLAAVAGDRLLAADILGCSSLYQRAWRKIAIGLTGEVYQGRQGRRPAAVVVTESFAALASSAGYSRPAPGHGTTLVAKGSQLVASSLLDRGRLVHAVVVSAGG